MNNGTLRNSKRMRSWYPPSKWNRVKMFCQRLGDELERLGFSHIDFMSLDVEGHEAAVLKGINWKVTTIDYILCENNCDVELGRRGYLPIELPRNFTTKERVTEKETD